MVALDGVRCKDMNFFFLILQGHVMQKSIHALVQTEKFQEWEELGELKYE